jgi:uroporphyrin-III C-methyltransferase
MLAESVSHPDQQLTRTTVTKLADLMAAEGSSTPALILYGALAAGRP